MKSLNVFIQPFSIQRPIGVWLLIAEQKKLNMHKLPGFFLMRLKTRELLECLTLICNVPCPVIASIQGQVMGGGVGLVAACDIALSEDHVTFSLPEVTVGMIPALITPFLCRRLTLGRIQYLALS